jgi:hypothetical protein
MKRQRVLIRIAQVAVIGAIALSLAACGCPGPSTFDQIFVLDATTGTPARIAFDAGVDAAVDRRADAGADAGIDAGPSMSVAGTAPNDCTPAAAGCVPGGACNPACTCVFTRDAVRDVGTVFSCTLLAGDGPARVEAHYQTNPTFCD